MKKAIIIFILFISLFNYKEVNANNIVNNQDIDIIKEKLKNNKTVYINFENNEMPIVKRKILDLIKNKDKTLIFNIKNNNNILYSYKFNGKYFNKSYNDIDLTINFNSTSYIDKIFNTNKKIVINTNYKGIYPSGTILSISNTKNLNKIYLYAIDKNNLIKINNTIKTNQTNIDININRGITYVITNKELIPLKTIYLYILILIILFIENIILITVIFKKKKIIMPKLKSN